MGGFSDRPTPTTALNIKKYIQLEVEKGVSEGALLNAFDDDEEEFGAVRTFLPLYVGWRVR